MILPLFSNLYVETLCSIVQVPTNVQYAAQSKEHMNDDDVMYYSACHD